MKKITIFLPLLLSACATQYVAPIEGETASLILPVQNSSWQFFGGASNAKVSFAIKGEDGCGRIYKQIEPDAENEELVEVKIPGNKDIFINYSANNGNTVCNTAGSFFALPNKKYEALKFGAGYACSVGVIEIKSNSERKPIPLKRAYPDTFSGSTICDKR